MEPQNVRKTYSPAVTAMLKAKKAKQALGIKVGGMPKGVKTRKTLEKQKVLRGMEQIIMQKSEKILRASLIPALGMNFVYRIDEETDLKGRVISRKHVLVESPEEIAEALDEMDAGGQSESGRFYYVTTRAPDYRAGESLLNRAFGKAKESVAVEVEHKFSLRDLGKRALDLEKERAKEIIGEEITHEPIALPAENIGTEVPPAEK